MPVQFEYLNQNDSVLLTLDLSRYIKTILDYKAKPNEQKKTAITVVHQEFVALTKDPVLWQDLITTVLKNTHISPSIKMDLSLEKPCVVFSSMPNNCVELVKNSMDELVLNAIRTTTTDVSAPHVLKMIFTFKLGSKDGLLNLTITDNAGGISSEAVLKKFNTISKDFNAFTKAITERKTSAKYENVELPPLFGGAGIGLNRTLGNICFNANLGRERLLVPAYEATDERSKMPGSVSFMNTKDSQMHQPTGLSIVFQCYLSDHTSQKIKYRLECIANIHSQLLQDLVKPRNAQQKIGIIRTTLENDTQDENENYSEYKELKTPEKAVKVGVRTSKPNLRLAISPEKFNLTFFTPTSSSPRVPLQPIYIHTRTSPDNNSNIRYMPDSPFRRLDFEDDEAKEFNPSF